MTNSEISREAKKLMRNAGLLCRVKTSNSAYAKAMSKVPCVFVAASNLEAALRICAMIPVEVAVDVDDGMPFQKLS